MAYRLENYQQALRYSNSDVDYFGIGPIFATQSKQDAAQPIGIIELNKIRKILTKPVVAIGGINQANINQVMECKVDGIAVISAILAASDPGLATKQISQLIKKYKSTYESL